MRSSPLDRREFLRASAAGAAALALGSGCHSKAARYPTPDGAPNVLFISIDDLNDWVGCLGNTQAQTPNLDALAERGILFTNAHCASPICNASRASALTGLAPSVTGVYANDQPFRLAVGNAFTIPEHFMHHGYRVVGTGKVFHTRYPDQRSWHEYHLPMTPIIGDIPYLGRTVPRGPDPEGRPLNGLRGMGAFDWGVLDVADDEMGDAKVAAFAAEKLAVRGSQPLFLATGINRPHLSWYVPRKYFDLYPLDSISLPEVDEASVDRLPEVCHPQLDREIHQRVLDAGQWAHAVRGYLAATSFADAMLGRILDALYEGPYGDDTIVTLWSDHGYHLGEKLCWGKATLWEESTRSPMIVVPPRSTPATGRSARSVGALDLYPTLIELCDLRKRPELGGDSLVPLLQNPDAAWDRPVVTTQFRGRHAVRSDRWRYIRYEDGSEELYDHDTDPLENVNLAADASLAAVRAQHANWLPEFDAPAASIGWMNRLLDLRRRVF